MRLCLTIVIVMLAASLASAEMSEPVHHQLEVQIDVGAHRIQVLDRLTPHSGDSLRFVLHADLEPHTHSAGWTLEHTGPTTAEFLGINASSITTAEQVPLEGWILSRDDPSLETVEIRYGGVIHHPLATAGEEYQRSFSETPGIVSEDGVFLSGTSFWVPTFSEELVTFELTVAGLTPPWDVVSQGQRTRHSTGHDIRVTTWDCPHPTEEVYLVAGPWHEYSDRAGSVEIFAFLRSADPGLAIRYLEATKRYLKLYEAILPPFPYGSFALVENFWETGYGMPGFTLLGPQVIRFPWILTSSYPHELLHNWWGNSAYVDFETGNWCEGLTAYMADHLFAEQKGESATYRRATLKKFSDFVVSDEDFSLAEFRSRRSAASEAVGYGKSLMLFHMMRRQLGDKAFLTTMNHFYGNSRFRRARFSDIAASATAVSGRDWHPFFDTWTTRSGAPELALAKTEVSADNPTNPERWILKVRLRQRQEAEPFPISVPLAITLEGRSEPLWHEINLEAREVTAEISCPARPLRIDVDPRFDVMRRLDPLEVPPALSTLLGADDPLFVLPSEATKEESKAWRALAAAWARPGTPRIVLDDEVEDLGASSAWVLGWTNRIGPKVLDRLAAHPVGSDEETLEIDGRTIDRDLHSLVLVARNAADASSAIGWVTAGPNAAIPGLARKLPHYSRYSYLAFSGEAPDNFLKGMWQPLASPLVRNLGDGGLPEFVTVGSTPLAELPPRFDADGLVEVVRTLAASEMEGRGLGSAGLDRATDWVESRFAELGLEPAFGETFRQTWSWQGGEPARDFELTNLVARKPGRDPTLSDNPVVVIAHLDHLGTGWPDVREGNQGRIHPGADDNASGVAVLLELATTLASEPDRARPVVFAAVTGEEAGLVGSRHLLSQLTATGLPSGCLNLDTVGRLADGKLFALNTDTAREWRFIFMGVGHTVGTPVEIVQEPLDSSDQVACIEHGVPAVQLFTGPTLDYHKPSDTADTIDGAGMVAVAEVALETVAYLVDRVEPLTITIGNDSGGSTAGTRSTQGGRRVSLGTMPDFGFPGPGVRVHQVTPGSPAADAGILTGDVLLAIDGHELQGLRDFSGRLKTYSPGDEISVLIERDGARITLNATLKAR